MDGINQGSQTLWEAVSQLPPGVQVSILILLAACAAMGWMIRYLLAELKANRAEDRRKDEAHRQQWEQILVALTVLRERGSA